MQNKLLFRKINKHMYNGPTKWHQVEIFATAHCNSHHTAELQLCLPQRITARHSWRIMGWVLRWIGSVSQSEMQPDVWEYNVIVSPWPTTPSPVKHSWIPPCQYICGVWRGGETAKHLTSFVLHWLFNTSLQSELNKSGQCTCAARGQEKHFNTVVTLSVLL